MTFEEKTMKTETIYDGKILKLRVDTVELPNMNYSHREIVEHSGSVAIVPLKDDETVYMVKQYRKAVEQVVLEFPAGLIEDGEDPKEAAQRELQEEIGYGAEKLSYINEVFSSPGFTDEKVDIFIAKDLYKSKLKADDDENIEIVEVKIKDLREMIDSFELQDAVSVIGALQILALK